MIYLFVLQWPVLRKDEFAYIFVLQNHKLIDHYTTYHLQNYLQWMTSFFSYNDDTKNIYNIVHRQSRKHFEAVSYYNPTLQHFRS